MKNRAFDIIDRRIVLRLGLILRSDFWRLKFWMRPAGSWSVAVQFIILGNVWELGNLFRPRRKQWFVDLLIFIDLLLLQIKFYFIFQLKFAVLVDYMLSFFKDLLILMMIIIKLNLARIQLKSLFFILFFLVIIAIHFLYFL